MLNCFKVRSSIRSYEVFIGSGIFEREYLDPPRALILDANVKALWPHFFQGNEILVEASENEKTFSGVEKIVSGLKTKGVTRKDNIVAVGGGIIQDLSTIAASVYMRGVSWDYFPTTLLSMVDSCIGGKSSINVGDYKNLVGNFYPPERIFIDVEFCASLPRDQFIEGICEALKICYADSEQSFRECVDLCLGYPFLGKTELFRLVELSLGAKRRFIEADEFDLGVRLLLNFGHTFGHAIESGSNFSVKHGIAVGLGMIVAEHVSRELRLLVGQNNRVESLVFYVERLMIDNDVIKYSLASIDEDALMRAFEADKKHGPMCYTAILFASDGSLVRYEFERNNENRAIVMKSFRRVFEMLQ